MKNLALFFILFISFKNLEAQTITLKTKEDTARLKSTFKLMGIEDQKYRNQSSELRKSKIIDSIEDKRISYMWHITDSLNRLKLDSLVNLYGIETVSEIGQGNTFLIVQHGELELQLKFLPVFKKLQKTGFITGQDLGLLIDRLLVRTLQKQIYGSQVCGNRETKEQFVCAMEDPDNVEIRRKEMNFPITLIEYCKYYNLVWDVEAYKKRLPEFEAIQKKNGKW
jgi:hypothetical protein